MLIYQPTENNTGGNTFTGGNKKLLEKNTGGNKITGGNKKLLKKHRW